MAEFPFSRLSQGTAFMRGLCTLFQPLAEQANFDVMPSSANHYVAQGSRQCYLKNHWTLRGRHSLFGRRLMISTEFGEIAQ